MTLGQKEGLIELIQDYLHAFGAYYPGIDIWFRKVWLESKAGKRRIWIVTSGGELSGLAITKIGKQAKLCHFSLSPSVRGKGIGYGLMRLALRDLMLKGMQTVHVTAGEEVAQEHGTFFLRCGFDLRCHVRDRYRRGNDELVWKATRESLAARLFEGLKAEDSAFAPWGMPIAPDLGVTRSLVEDAWVHSVMFRCVSSSLTSAANASSISLPREQSRVADNSRRGG